jgi:hypothetical protein
MDTPGRACRGGLRAGNLRGIEWNRTKRAKRCASADPRGIWTIAFTREAIRRPYL